jgi:hypothetical protein
MTYSVSSIINGQHEFQAEFNGHFAFSTDIDDEISERGEPLDYSEMDTESSDSENQSPQAITPEVKISPEKAPLAGIFNRQINPDMRIGDFARLYCFLTEKALSEYDHLEHRDKSKATVEQFTAFCQPNGSQEQFECREKEKQYRNRQRIYATQRAAVGEALDDMEELLVQRKKKEEKNQLKLQEQNSIPLVLKQNF